MRLVQRLSLSCAALCLLATPLLAQTSIQASPDQPVRSVSRAPRAPRPLTYGTSAVSYVEVPASAFFPGDSAVAWTSDAAGWGPRWATNVSADFVAPIHLPTGAKLVYLELDFVDTNASTAVYGSLVVCDSWGTGCVAHPNTPAGPVDCQIGGYICSGNAFVGGFDLGSADLTTDGITINNSTGSYRLDAITNSTDGSNKIGGMIVGYVLQVSPAPGTATFTDVPTTHPQFRFVEALVAAGITGGCGGGNYCPDSPLTRGQMAVFLSTALGLQWQ